MAQRIDVKDLNIYYGDFLAVQDVSMAIEPKSVTAFIGPSGCGKSTFLRTLNRMHEVIPGARVEGTVAMEGVDLYGNGVDPVAVRRQVGMVFQRPNPFPTMSIYENIAFGVRLFESLGATDCIPTINYDRAWAAALTLIIIVMLLNLIGRLITRFFAPKNLG